MLPELCNPFRYLWRWFGEELLPLFLMVLESFLPQWCWLACRLLWLGGYRFTGWYRLANWLHIFRLERFFWLNRLERTKSWTRRAGQRSNGVIAMLRMNSTIHCHIKAAGDCNYGCLNSRSQNELHWLLNMCINLPHSCGLKTQKWLSLDWSLALSCLQLTGWVKTRSSTAAFSQECDGLVLGM